MSKMMSDCWLSPHGDVYYCFSHIAEANNIIDKYGLNDEFAESRYFPHVEPFLESKGWIKYSTNRIYPDWCFTQRTHLTQTQIDKIYELTGEVFEDKNLL
ncbi:hypothetical protein II582_05130 [bacterium]|nr:hypothetical protein [bacterium]